MHKVSVLLETMMEFHGERMLAVEWYERTPVSRPYFAPKLSGYDACGRA